MEAEADLECQDCGTADEVKVTECPAAEELYDKVVMIAVCDRCFRERAWNV